MPPIVHRLPPIRLLTLPPKNKEACNQKLQDDPLPAVVASKRMTKRADEVATPTLRPPTPYRPGRVAIRARRSVLPSLFEMKLVGTHHRALNYRTMIEAGRRMEERYHKTVSKPNCKRLLRQNVDPVLPAITEAAGEAAVSSQHTLETSNEEVTVQYSSVDQAMRECFLLEAIYDQVMKEETAGRVFIDAEEHYYFTTVLVDASHSFLEVLAERNGDLMEEIRFASASREEERNTFFHNISEQIHQQFQQKRLEEKLQSTFIEQLTLYTTSMEDLRQHEEKEWLELLVWNEKRIKVYDEFAEKAKVIDYRITKKTTKNRHKKHGGRHHTERESSTERFLRVLRAKKRLESQLVLFDCDGAKDASRECVYALVGREAHQKEKERKAVEHSVSRRFEFLEEDELDAREEMQKLESEQWIPLMLFGIDGYYAAKRATRERLELEELKRKKDLGDEVARAEIKRRLLAKEFNEKMDNQEITTYPWTPDDVAS